MSTLDQGAFFSGSNAPQQVTQLIVHDNQIIRLKELCQLLGLSRSTIYERMKEHSKYHDPDFPRNFKLNSCGTGRAVGWRQYEVDAYIDKIAAHQAKVAA
jgi:prophage regulatory protein